MTAKDDSEKAPENIVGRALDIVQNGVVEQDGVLGHDSHVGAQGRLSNLAYVLPIHFDYPRGGIIEAEQQPQRTGFSAACVPSQSIHVRDPARRTRHSYGHCRALALWTDTVNPT